MDFIPFNRTNFEGREQEYLVAAAASGHLAGDGQFTRQCHALLSAELGVPKVLLTTSCTHALEMAALLLDIQPGDEVIVPAFTFVSSINAFVLRGARPIFIDSRSDTLNLDETVLEELITPRTKAIIVMHYAGVACAMDVIMDVAARHQIPVIEDNAHGLFARYRGQYLGTFGALATQSFHETKNFTCGEGGALLINAADYVERAEIIREKGTNRSRFFRGQVDKYTWVDVGSSYLPSELLAAVLYGQLEARAVIQAKRRGVWNYYFTHLQSWAQTQHVQLPTVPPDCEQPSHLFYLLLPTLEQRQRLIAHLKERGIASVFHYLPLNTSEMGQRLGGCPGQCPVAESASDRLLRLPFYNSLDADDLGRIVAAVQDFRV
jgi:dTDP-4-amino-4,6-dideoxygalactose transaminase